MNRKISIITIGLLAMIGLSVLGYQHYTQETDGKYFREWHSLRTDSFKEVRRNFSPLDDMAKERISFQPELIKKYSANLVKATQPLASQFEPKAPWGDANASIWSEGSEFQSMMAEFVATTEKLSEETPNDLKRFQDTLHSLRNQCIECHKKYKD
ncbi:Cytochrome c-556 [Marinobacterium sp. xm-a-121]|uniref:cytochrome c n=1 Tax=unclassified Marinobacterium TaxID=2644139 RepID=UPI0015694EEF|nr:MULTISPECIES: cytochrome c [unclassified Marinobacterium]NRP38284.1 Cytochrome c-556 [Marinobacterium sp. xm-a-121]NRP47067.1 Cytochrome c-556 [Marinobacterium sp. xm-d-543]NRP59921.1 Cytochrome c-556 [Marinobacterium sp. xm-d-564]NRP98700.1 Cytochrome c-556 [Marinobacterium sp. xm-v-233]NRQ22968.1 Cytochrome c-556 [Marinobacterium sp. xm-m-312]